MESEENHELTEKLNDEFKELLTLTDDQKARFEQATIIKPKRCSLPSKYIRKTDGIYFLMDAPKSPLGYVGIIVCSPLEIIAHVSDECSHGHGLLLSFTDRNNVEHRWVLRSEMLAGDGEIFRKCLMDMGFRIYPGYAQKLLQEMFILVPDSGPRHLCVSKPGWHNDIYVLGNEYFGTLASNTYDGAFFPIESHDSDYWGVAGNLNDWINNVSIPCIGNSRLIFAISMAFSSVLIDPLNQENVGFNFFGRSSTGKTTLLFVANSVFGGKGRIQTWRGTSNGIEAITETFNDALICMDELAQIPARDAGNVAYMLGNGVGKLRANVDGGPRTKRTWNLTVMSSGEIPLADHVATAGEKAKAGQLVRMVDIPAEVPNGFGVFENLPLNTSGSAFSKDLKNNATQYYGVVVREFLKQLTHDLNGWVDHIKQLADKFKVDNVDRQADGQVERVADRFASIAAVGEVATYMNLTGWKKGEATNAAVKCFKDWIEHRGGIGDRETSAVLEQVRYFFELNGETRFSPWTSSEGTSRTINRAGYVKVENGHTYYYVFTEVFKNDICRGLNRKVVVEVLKKYGYLVCGQGSKQEPSIIANRPGSGSGRFYKIWRILDDPDAQEQKKQNGNNSPFGNMDNMF